MQAEQYIADLKAAAGRLSLTYGAAAVVDALTYAKNEHGTMQRTQINEILDMIARLNHRIDEIYESYGPAVHYNQGRPAPDTSIAVRHESA